MNRLTFQHRRQKLGASKWRAAAASAAVRAYGTNRRMIQTEANKTITDYNALILMGKREIIIARQEHRDDPARLFIERKNVTDCTFRKSNFTFGSLLDNTIMFLQRTNLSCHQSNVTDVANQDENFVVGSSANINSALNIKGLVSHMFGYVQLQVYLRCDTLRGLFQCDFSRLNLSISHPFAMRRFNSTEIATPQKTLMLHFHNKRLVYF